MGPEKTAEFFNITSTIQSTNTSLFLNIAAGETTSYKTLTFGNVSTDKPWGLEGDTIITAGASTWKRREFAPPTT